MKGFDPNAKIAVGKYEFGAVLYGATPATADSEQARHWLTGQPLEGVYVRARPLQTPLSITVTYLACDGEAK